MNLQAPVTHFLPSAAIRRERRLPSPGRVLIRAGQKVASSDILAETNLNPEYQLLDIPHILGISIQKADRILLCKPGDRITQGDLIAGPIGISKKVVRAKSDSRVILVGDGQVLLETIKSPFQLKAGYPGRVVELIPDRGAVIETDGSLIQAVWGNNQQDSGILMMLAKQPDHLFSPEDLDISLRGVVVAAGHCREAEALRKAEEAPLRGIILGSMDVDLLPIAKNLQIPILLTEGFGCFPMNPIAHKLLMVNERREVAVIAQPWDPYAGSRPEIVIPQTASGQPIQANEIASFNAGKQVRILHPPNKGKLGTLLSLKNKEIFPGGYPVLATEIQLQDGSITWVPAANLEILQ